MRRHRRTYYGGITVGKQYLIVFCITDTEVELWNIGAKITLGSNDVIDFLYICIHIVHIM